MPVRKKKTVESAPEVPAVSGGSSIVVEPPVEVAAEPVNPAVAALAAVGPPPAGGAGTPPQGEAGVLQVGDSGTGATAEPQVEAAVEPPVEPENGQTEPAAQTRQGHAWLWAVVGLITGVVLGGGGVFLVLNRGMAGIPSASQKTGEQQETAEEPTATPVVELDRADLRVQVLNGSGVAGAAATAKALLEGMGYEEVAVGNADVDDALETEISIKESKADYMDLLIEDLGGDYELASQTASLEADSEYDAVIVLGAKKSE